MLYKVILLEDNNKILLEDKMNLSLGFVFFLLTCMNYYYYFNLEEDRFSLM